MRKSAAVFLGAAALSTAAAVGPIHSQGYEPLARFSLGIGVDPVAGVATANGDGTFANVRQNVVKGVAPAPGAWRITDLKATIDVDGRIRVKGRGLVLAGGDNIGRTLNLSVFATLFCEAAAPFVPRNSAASNDGITFEGAVPLEPNGDFRIDDSLKTIGNFGVAVPAECPSPTLLIRAASGAWLAAGIPQFAADEN